jgi:endoglucanase
MHLEALSNAFGPSSAEDDVRRLIFEAVKPHVDAWRVDTMGNLFVTRHRRLDGPLPPPVMLAAHMDEVGFIITEVKKNGLLKFKAVGGFDPRVLLGKAVVVGPERLPGVIGLKPIHLLKSGEFDTVGGIDTMFIDVGADSDASAKVKPGDLATFATRFSYLGGQAETGPTAGRVKGKALDDRVGCALLIELLQGDYPFDLMGVFTVQEEIGLRGARVAGYAVNPAVTIVLECTAADDLPRRDETAEPGIPVLGGGPALTAMDRSFIAHRPLLDVLINTAEAAGLPWQFKRPGIGGTDAGAIHLTRAGVPTAVVSVPARYIHSPAAIIDLADFWHTHQLVQAALPRLAEQSW